MTSFIADEDSGSNKCPPMDKDWSNGDRPLCKKSGPIQVNHCAIGNTCHQNATCHNKLNDYMCKCNDGYVGDGVFEPGFKISFSNWSMTLANQYLKL